MELGIANQTTELSINHDANEYQTTGLRNNFESLHKIEVCTNVTDISKSEQVD